VKRGVSTCVEACEGALVRGEGEEVEWDHMERGEEEEEEKEERLFITPFHSKRMMIFGAGVQAVVKHLGGGLLLGGGVYCTQCEVAVGVVWAVVMEGRGGVCEAQA
jgi:hypothetical protein